MFREVMNQSQPPKGLNHWNGVSEYVIVYLFKG